MKHPFESLVTFGLAFGVTLGVAGLSGCGSASAPVNAAEVPAAVEIKPSAAPGGPAPTAAPAPASPPPANGTAAPKPGAGRI